MSQKEQDLWRAVKGIIRIGGTVAFASLFPSRPDVDYMSVDVVGPSLGLQTGPRYALIATALAPDFMTEKATDGEAAEQEALLNADSGDPQQDSGPPEEIQDEKTRQNIRNCTGCIELYRIPFEVQGAAGSGKVLQGSGLGR